MCGYACVCVRVCVHACVCTNFECRPQYVLARLQDIGRFLTLPPLWPRNKQAVNCTTCKYTHVYHPSTSHFAGSRFANQQASLHSQQAILCIYLFIYYVLQVWDEATFSCRRTNPAFGSESLNTSSECTLCRLQISSQST